MRLRVFIIASVAAFISVWAVGSAAAQSVCPDDFVAFAGTTDPLSCTCDAEATQRGHVRGMDVYSANSSVCMAALHAGVVGSDGGAVTVIPEPGRKAYPGVTRNGVTSYNTGEEEASFRFETAAAAAQPAEPKASEAPAATTGASAGSVCPDDFEAYAGTTDPVPCTCDAEAVERGHARGMDVYTANSSVCRAALHAGVVGANGGAVTVIPEPGRKAYPGVTRNGVTSYNDGESEASFRFETAAAAGSDGTKSASGSAIAVSVCPDDFEAYTGTTDPVPCTCDAEAVERGHARGMDVYTANSSVCRAALHAGVVGKDGGAVTVIPEAGRKAYPGVTRNGVTSYNEGPADASFRFEGPVKAAAVVPDKPVQKPIAETIKATGEVALYINFEFNSADLAPTATPTLMELRDALTATPDLRLLLVGHTDAIGGADYNRTLSFNRALSVQKWLVTNGITPQRLAVDGKGLDQPIADNNTEAGRATNRRVQAVRIE